MTAFWTTVHKYATSKLPYNDEVLANSQWIDFFGRSEMKYANVNFFLYCFPAVSLTPAQIDSLRDEFDDYKTLTDDEMHIKNCSVNIKYKDMYGTAVKKDYTEWIKLGKYWKVTITGCGSTMCSTFPTSHEGSINFFGHPSFQC